MTSRERIWFGLLAAALLAFFLPLWNPYWVRGGDSEVYLCLARSLVLGEGYRFNGQPVALVPPGWPWLLAGAMKLSSSFAVLKLLPLICMALGLALFWRALLPFASRSVAALAVIVAAMLVPVFQLTYWFHSEAVFCLITSAALVLACRMESGAIWRISTLMLLCVAAMFARWAAILWWPVLAGVLLHGELRPRWNSRWIATVLTGAVTLLAFLELRSAMRVDPSLIDPRFDASLSGGYSIVNKPNPDDTLRSRVIDSGLWFSRLFWSPAAQRRLRPMLRIAGAALAALFVVGVWRSIRRREWIWLGLAICCAALALNWPQPVPRYLVPVAPLLIVAIFNGIEDVKGWFRPALVKQLGACCSVVLLIGTVAINLKSYLSEVAVMRSSDFHDKFQGGMDRQLISAAEYLRQTGLRDGELVVTRRAAKIRAEVLTNGWMRAAHFLTGRAVRSIPDELTGDPESPTFQWVRQQGARYYLWQPRVNVDGHQLNLTFDGKTFAREEMDWKLYQVANDGAEQVELSPSVEPIRRVPGL